MCPLPLSGSCLSAVRSRPDLLRRNLRAGSPPRPTKGGTATLPGNSAWSRPACRAKSPVPSPAATRDGSWSGRGARRRFFALLGRRRDFACAAVRRTTAGAPDLSPLRAPSCSIPAPVSPSSWASSRPHEPCWPPTWSPALMGSRPAAAR